MMYILFLRCIEEKKYQQAIGMAIECRRLDKIAKAIKESGNVDATLSYCSNISHNFVSRREYRSEVSIIMICTQY